MKLFIVRHAEGASYTENWQSPDISLSDKGKRQAEALAGLQRIKLAEIVISSNWARAKETAEIATKGLGKQIDTISDIEERHQSSKIYGLSRTSEVSKNYSKDLIKNYSDWNWKWDSEEESFDEVCKRAIKFRDYLIKNYQQKNVLIFSHETFIRLLISICIFGDNYQNKYFRKFYRSTAIEPTSVSLIIYREQTNTWKLWYLNDYSHLSLVR